MSRRITGIHPVTELLKTDPGRIETLYLQKGDRKEAFRQVESLARSLNVSLRYLDSKEFERRMGPVNHQGVVAFVQEFRYVDFDGWLASLVDAEEKPDVLVLDRVQDPHNLGSLLRTAENFGLAGVLIPKDGGASVTEAVIRVAAGAAEHVPVLRVVNLRRALEAVKKAGYWIYGTDPQAADSLYETDLSGPSAFVLGNEAEGMRRLVRETCDGVLSLPSRGRIDSLNVAVAGGVVLSESFRQKCMKKPAE